MSLLVALQHAVDIAFHIAADEGWGVAQSYADGFDKLREHEVLDGELAAELGNVARLSNRLTHGYGSMDFQRLWTEAPRGSTHWSDSPRLWRPTCRAPELETEARRRGPDPHSPNLGELLVI